MTTVAVKERPIIFAPESVRATYAGRKTMTRRVVTVPWAKGKRTTPYEPHYVESDGRLLWMDEYGDYHPMEPLCPYGVPGDRLWVKEPFALEDAEGCDVGPEDPEGDTWRVHYRTGPDDVAPTRWRSPRFMHRWASRLLLEVTDVRVERVQDISEEDARAEGAPARPNDLKVSWGPYRCGFADLWDSLNARRGFPWEANPWVWCISFRRVEP